MKLRTNSKTLLMVALCTTLIASCEDINDLFSSSNSTGGNEKLIKRIERFHLRDNVSSHDSIEIIYSNNKVQQISLWNANNIDYHIVLLFEYKDNKIFLTTRSYIPHVVSYYEESKEYLLNDKGNVFRYSDTGVAVPHTSRDSLICTYYYDSDGYLVKLTREEFGVSMEYNISYFNGNIKHIDFRSPYNSGTFHWDFIPSEYENKTGFNFIFSFIETYNLLESLSYFSIKGVSFGKVSKNLPLRVEYIGASSYRVYYEFAYEFDKDGYLTKIFITATPGMGTVPSFPIEEYRIAYY
jgi:hypothetical protein